VKLIEQSTPDRTEAKPEWRRDVRRRMNMSLHQHRTRAALFTLYFCECDELTCELKVALTDGEFRTAVAGGKPIVHPRCPGVTGRSRRRLWRRKAR
jgi:hypothetical protein